eukprot:Phypoly_transcript_12434.p1 GENE.Phypoly_transcript_12434~~Phypoly_transcript_12434.p1  ORF type:complete len:324 (+),score=53.03 Phypoly_transcript_12434:105-1076(+)
MEKEDKGVQVEKEEQIDKEMQSDPPPEGFSDMAKNFANLMTSMQMRFSELEQKEKWWKGMEERMASHAKAAAKKITLDVGGQHFTTTKETLLSCQGSFFEAMLGSGHWKPDEDGVYFIDRSPTLFPIIMDFLRYGKINLERYSYDVMPSLTEELDFYQITIPSITNKAFYESQLLTEPFFKYQILAWIGKDLCTERIYNASKDGFGADVFHKKCDNKGPTVVIVKTIYNTIFGGYTSSSWDTSQKYLAASLCFVFSLTPPLKNFPVNKEAAIFGGAANGPVFGSGHDLYIANNSHDCYLSYRNFGGIKENFRTTGIEVFRVYD